MQRGLTLWLLVCLALSSQWRAGDVTWAASVDQRTNTLLITGTPSCLRLR